MTKINYAGTYDVVVTNEIRERNKPNLDYGAAADQENQIYTDMSGCSSSEVLYQNVLMEQNPTYI